MLLLLAILGLLAGSLTSVAGLGGGMLLLVALSLFGSPAAALAATAPALLVGNLHRAWLSRAALDRRVARTFALGAIPGAFAGGLFAVAVPDLLLRALLAATAAISLARALGWWRPRAPFASLAPAGVAIGGLTATTGGAGLLAAPLFQSTGLRGEAYLATLAAAAASMHVGRLAAYGLGGWLDAEALTHAAVLAVALLGGNLLGRRVRSKLSESRCEHIEIATLLACLAMALLGLG